MPSKEVPQPDHFTPVGPSKEPLEFVKLKTVDLGRFDEGPEARAELAEIVRVAMVEQGFFNVINHGVAEDVIERQVDIGYTVIKNTPQDEKLRLQSKIIENGSYPGFKPRAHWKVGGGVRDKIEQYNLYRDMSAHEQPKAIEPYIPEVQELVTYIHGNILAKICRLFALALKLDDADFFVKAHSSKGHDESWMRYMMYFDDFTDEEMRKSGGVWLNGHCDLSALSLLFSQPMSALQILEDDGEWRFVRHVPGGMIVNCGEIMSWWTGDYFRAAIHRVSQPPVDQRGHDRAGIFYFAVPNDEVVINTVLDQSPVLREAGVKMKYAPGEAPTSKDWVNGRIKMTGQSKVLDEKYKGVREEKVGNATTRWYG